MNKSTKLVSLFLSTAIVLSTAGCGRNQQVVYDKNGNPIIQEDDDDDGGFFYHIYRPFGFHSSNYSSYYGSGVTRSSGAMQPPDTSSTSKSNPGISGVSPWGKNGSTSSSSSSSSSGSKSSSGGTGISSGSHGGIGGGGSSAS